MEKTWNLTPLYKSIKDPQIQKDIKTSQKNVDAFCKKWKNTDTYLKDPKVLKEALDEYETLGRETGICEKPLYYLILLNNLDQENVEVKGLLNKVHGIEVKLSNEIQFFELNISKIEKDKQDIFLNSKELAEYKHVLEQLFKQAEYLLSDTEEKIFNLTNKTSYSNWADMISELLDKQELEVLNEQGKKEKITYNQISKYINSKDKRVRDYASNEFNKINERYAEIAEFEINSILEHKKMSDEYRGVARPDLLRHLGDDLDSEVVDTLIDTVSKNFDISKEYYTKKAKLLGQDNLGYHERNVPVGEVDLEYSYEDAISLVKKTFKNIDKEFVDVVSSFEQNGQYDAFPNEGKSGGAFCISINKTLPTYILLNHNNKLNDVLTIAHESGHGIHTELSKVQNSLNSDYPTSLAEVASTFFEDYVLEEILKNADDDTKQSILIQKLDSDISTIFRQVAFYKFEYELHKTFRQDGYVSKEKISELFSKNMKAYLGDTVLEDDGMRYGWVYWTHLRRFFYVYSYASGLLISKGLQKMVKENGRDIEKVKTFLSSGSTKSPKDIFGGIGIDISKESFWQSSIDETEKLLKKL